jgi:Zn-dependent peptidase ImmA (M78 family)/DNA-binding XRE family transcriptional regulator
MLKQEVNYKMIELARISRGLSQNKLSSILKIEQGTLSKIENGELSIKDDLLKNLSEQLNYPESFFYEEINVLSPLLIHYRKRKSANQGKRAFIESHLYIRKHIIKKLLKSLEIPNKVYDLNPYEYNSPENVARLLRQKWHVPKGPISNLTKLVESSGIFVLYVDHNDEKLDGELMPDEHGLSVIYINKDISPDRQRYTLAHELGHLIMHCGKYIPTIEEAEVEADRFASEFLMPELEIKHQLSSRLSFSQLGDLKRYWKCSMSSIVMRAYKLGIIGKDRYTSLYVQLSRAGYKKKEPEMGIVKEVPQLLWQLIDLHQRDLTYSDEELANLFNLTLTDERTKSCIVVKRS